MNSVMFQNFATNSFGLHGFAALLMHQVTYGFWNQDDIETMIM